MKKIIWLWFTLLACCSSLSAADPYVTAQYRPSGAGYAMEFTVHNILMDDSVSDFVGYQNVILPGFVWYLGVITEDSANPIGPDGWSARNTSRDVQWTALASEHMVAPGQSVSGFIYTAQSVPATLSWFVQTEYGYTGSVTPTAVPEPSSLLALGSGLVALGGLVRRRRR